MTAIPSRKDLSKSFAQLSLPTCLEISSKAVEGHKLEEDDDIGDKDEDTTTALATISTSNVIVVVAKAPIKAYTQFGPLQVCRKT